MDNSGSKNQRKRKRTQKFQVFTNKKRKVDPETEIKGIEERLEKWNATPDKFEDFPLSEKTQRGLSDCKYVQFTNIQSMAILNALRGQNVWGKAKTGSGKTLAFVIPVIEKLYKEGWSKEFGVGAIVLSPTAELAKQTYDVFNRVGKYHNFSIALVIGGGNRLKAEKERLGQINILICTPGRLVQHINENPDFRCDNLQILVLDETDLLLEQWFMDQILMIIDFVPPTKQILLFSATQTKKVDDLMRLGAIENTMVSYDYSRVKNLEQRYILISIKHKVNLLWSFLTNHYKSKVMVFVTSCKQVRFFTEIFPRLEKKLRIMGLHSEINPLRRIALIDKFKKSEYGILVATDLAARGLDFPSVKYVIHYDCPKDINAYIHRTGRTSRMDMEGQSVLFLMPHEQSTMLKLLEQNNITIVEGRVRADKLGRTEENIAGLLAKDVNLKNMAVRTFQKYLISTHLMENKELFNIRQLDLDDLARSLGLNVTPPNPVITEETAVQEVEEVEAPESRQIFPVESADLKVDELPELQIHSGPGHGIFPTIRPIVFQPDRTNKRQGFTYKDYQLSNHIEELDALANNNLIDFFKRVDQLLEPWEKDIARNLSRYYKMAKKQKELSVKQNDYEASKEDSEGEDASEEKDQQEEEDDDDTQGNSESDEEGRGEEEDLEEDEPDEEEANPAADESSHDMEVSFNQESDAEDDDRLNPDLLIVNYKDDDKNISNEESNQPYKRKSKPRVPLIDFKNYSETVTLKKNTPFDSLGEIKLNPKTLQVLQDSKLLQCTRIQARTLPHMLDMKDVTMLSKTGTGKTLAFLLPLVEVVIGLQVKVRQGTKVVVLSPSQELARQTHGLLLSLLAPYPQSAALICGHLPKEQERKALAKRLATFIVATPARLLGHLKTMQVQLRGFMSLVIDEADLMLTNDLYRESILEIMERLDRPTHWYQKVLVCATVNEQVRLFAGSYFRPQASATVGHEEEMATVRKCAQHLVRVGPQDKLALLYVFLKRCQEHKLKSLVFLNTCAQVQFFHELFNYINVPVCAIHSKMDKAEERRTLRRFQRETGLGLLCTDVMARGMDLPEVGAVLQLDLPRTVEDYIHRVGRTARAGHSGVAYLALIPSELAFLRLLAPRVPLSWATFTVDNNAMVVHHHVQKNLYLKKSARLACTSGFKALNSHPYAKQLGYSKLDRKLVARSYGLTFAPNQNGQSFQHNNSVSNPKARSFHRKGFALNSKAQSFHRKGSAPNSKAHSFHRKNSSPNPKAHSFHRKSSDLNPKAQSFNRKNEKAR